MRRVARVIRHARHEGLAGWTAPLADADYAIDMVDANDPALAGTDWVAPDLLIAMGGPMGVYERDRRPWIDVELAGLARRIAAGRPTLGVCFGAQMIAAALGANVYAGPVKEIGFAPVRLSAAGLASPLRHLAEVDVLHWHGDTFDLPEGAELLAATHLYPNQAFRVGERLLALQFHPEMGEEDGFARWLEADAGYMRAAGADPDTLRADHARLGPGAVRAGRALLAEWLAGLPS